eukprot:scaffold13448_cov109-Isochrysis_galbana.AAC.5
MDELGRLARRSKGPGAVDRTRYGLHRTCPQCFVVHHMQRLSKAAVVFDAKAIKKGAISLKQLACHDATTSGQLLVSSVCSCFISSVNVNRLRPPAISSAAPYVALTA